MSTKTQAAPSGFDLKGILDSLRTFWVELPLRERFHGFALILSFAALLTSMRSSDKVRDLHVILTASVFLVLLLPIIAEGFMRAIRFGPKVSAKEGAELQALSRKLEELESDTKFLLRHYGPDALLRDFDRVFPYKAAEAGGLVSRFAETPEQDAQKLLERIHEIMAQIGS